VRGGRAAGAWEAISLALAALSSPFIPPALGKIFVRQTETAARTLGLRLDLYRVERSDDLAGAFQAAIRAREGAVIVIANPFFGVHEFTRRALGSRLSSSSCR
jgi:hypothetical protein